MKKALTILLIFTCLFAKAQTDLYNAKTIGQLNTNQQVSKGFEIPDTTLAKGVIRFYPRSLGFSTYYYLLLNPLDSTVYYIPKDSISGGGGTSPIYPFATIPYGNGINSGGSYNINYIAFDSTSGGGFYAYPVVISGQQGIEADSADAYLANYYGTGIASEHFSGVEILQIGNTSSLSSPSLMLYLDNRPTDSCIINFDTTKIRGNLSIIDGTQGVGKVFTDVTGTGVGTWQPGGGTPIIVSDSAWSLTGNAGTNSGTNFIGTVDSPFFYIRVANIPAGEIRSDSGQTAYGVNSNATNYNSTALGETSIAGGNGSTALGASSIAGGSSSTALGVSSIAAGSSSTALGVSSIAAGSGSTALGASSSAPNDNATALGISSMATGVNSTALGETSNAGGSSSTAIGFSSSAAGSGATAIGLNSSAPNDNATALGENSNAAGSSSTAIGFSSNAGGSSSTAIGFSSSAARSGATAIGFSSNATNYNSTALGETSNAGGNGATAIGFNSSAAGVNSTALGSASIVNTNYSTAIGFNSTVNKDSSMVLGDTLTCKYVGIGTTIPSSLFHVSGGSVTIQDGTQAANKVLTSDANGLASWQYMNKDTIINVTGQDTIPDGYYNWKVILVWTSLGSINENLVLPANPYRASTVQIQNNNVFSITVTGIDGNGHTADATSVANAIALLNGIAGVPSQYAFTYDLATDTYY